MSVAEKNVMRHGEKAPDFQNLQGVDGKLHRLSDFSDKTVVVIFFSCNHCPYVQAYEDRIMALQSEFQTKGVQFIAINANDDKGYPEDSFDNMVKRAHERKFNFVYLRDESQAVALSYHATHTPHIFVFNAERKLSYTGRIDDNWENPAQVTKTYLKNALTALVEGREPVPSETFAIGCTIKWKR